VSARLGEMLLQVGTLTKEQLEQVLSAQSIYGGRIGTNLVEMGLLSEEALGRLLNEKAGVPCIDAASLEQVPPSLIAILPQEMVQRLQVLPVALGGKKLTLAMKDPANFSAIDEVGFFTGLVVVPRVCSELRLAMALERYYGIKRVLHFIPVAGGMRTRMASMTGLTKEIAEPVVPEGSGPQIADMLSCLESTSRGRDSSTQPGFDPGPGKNSTGNPGATYTPNPDGTCETKCAAGLGIDPGSSAGPGRESARHGSMEEIARKFGAATGEAEVVTILMSYLKAEFDRVALMSLRRGAVVGVQAFSCGSQVPSFNGCALELAEATLLKGVLEKRAPYLGKLPEVGMEARILAKMGGAPGAAALLVPLSINGASVAFLLVQDEKGRLAPGLFDLQRVVAKAGLAFEMIGIRKKIGLA